MNSTRPIDVPAAVTLAVFAVVGVAALDDYGVQSDELPQREIGLAAIEYVLGDAAALRADRYLFPHDRYYGAAFEAPLVLVERLLGLTDSRAMFLSRRLLTHLFFLTGGFFCYLLAFRLFGDRRLALFALLLFLLHPRLYAHSFFNTKDIPFLTLFMIALYLLERAFRRGTAAAFAACGVSVGVLINVRVMGVMLFAAAVGLRAPDLALARGPAQRRRLLATAGAFVLAAAGTLYAVSPWLWRDPLAIVDAFATLAVAPSRVVTLFQGEPVRWPGIPPHYLPTWMAITTPPATLLLCLIGAAAAVRRGIARPGSVAGNTGVRFAWLLIACLALPVAAIAALRPNLYDGWRQMYFLYAPACLLAVYGLRALLAAAPRRRGAGLRHGRLRHGRLLRRGTVALAAAALVAMAAAGVRLHPYQQAYFNFLVDRRTPEQLRTRYEMSYSHMEYREALEYLLARYPDLTLSLQAGNLLHLEHNRAILPAAARRRVVIAGQAAAKPANFYVNTRFRGQPPFGPVLYARRVYHNTIVEVIAVNLALVDAATAADYRAAYRAAVAGEPLLRSQFGFDLYLDGRTLTWAKESCRPEDTAPPFVVRAVPAAVDDLPPRQRDGRAGILDFHFGRYGVRFDGRCLIRRPLPDYPILTLEVGRGVAGAGSVLEAAIDLRAAGAAVRRQWPDNPYWQAHAAIAAGKRGSPAARGAFDLYLDASGTELTYHKAPCAPEETRGRFFLHVFPADAAELAAGERQAGFSNRSFLFAEYGALLGGVCAALVPLPAWEGGIARIRTSQSNRWSVEFAAGE